MAFEPSKNLLPFLLTLCLAALGCGEDEQPLDDTNDPSDQGDGDSSSDEGENDDDESSDADEDSGDGDSGDGDSGDGDSGDGDSGDGDTAEEQPGDGDTGEEPGDGDTDVDPGDGDTGDGDMAGDGDDDDPPEEEPGFDEEAAKAVLVRSCGTCHQYGHPKFSIMNGPDLDLNSVKEHAAEMANSLYDEEESMPPSRADGPQIISDEERENLHAYLLSLAESP